MLLLSNGLKLLIGPLNPHMLSMIKSIKIALKKTLHVPWRNRGGASMGRVSGSARGGKA